MNRKEKKYAFVFRKEWKEAISGLPNETRLEMYDAIIGYGIDGYIPELSSMGTFAFNLIKDAIDKDKGKYEDVLRARSEAGKKHRGNQYTTKRGTNIITMEQMEQTQIKEVSPSSPLEENVPIPLKEDNPPISPEESTCNSCANASAYEAFQVWLKENCPYIFKNIPIMSEVEFQKLKERFGAEAMAEVLQNIENRKDKRKLYANMYRTMLNWLKRNEDDRKTTTNHREERLAGYGNAIATYLSTD